jgi:hypothetical protein
MAQLSGVLAIEFAAPVPEGPVVIPTQEASMLLEAIATDLARLAPDAVRCDLVAAGALYDVAQLLRPGWPIEAELVRLRQGLGARASGQVVAFGAAGGSLPSPLLEPEPSLAGGAMLLLPWMLLADPEAIAAAAADMESRFEDEGLAGAGVNLFLRQSLGREVTHARYLTRNDLLALTALQLDHAGLGPAWVILETALLAPEDGVVVELPLGGSLSFDGERVKGWLPGLAAHLASGAATTEAIEAFARQLGFQRSATALFSAHGLASTWRISRSDSTRLLENEGTRDGAWEVGGRLVRLVHPSLGIVGLVEVSPSGSTTAFWPLDRQILLSLFQDAEGAVAAGKATLETKTLAEWASVLLHGHPRPAAPLI